MLFVLAGLELGRRASYTFYPGHLSLSGFGCLLQIL